MSTHPYRARLAEVGRRAIPRSWPAAAVAGAILTMSGLLIWFAKDLWFYLDDWAFLLKRGVIEGSTNEGIWVPHADHWMTIPTLIYRGIHSVFGLTYLPYALVVVGLHAAIVAITYRLLLRHGAAPWVAAIASILLAFAGAGAEALLWDGTMGLIGSVLCGLLAVLWIDQRRTNLQLPVISWLVLVAGLMNSGTGVPATVFAVIYTWVSAGLRRALVLMSVPLAVFAAWYVAFGWRAAPYVAENRDVYLQIPRYVWNQLTFAFDGMGIAPTSGAMLLGALVLGVPLLPGIPTPLRHLAYAGQVAAAVQLLLAGASRIWLAGAVESGVGRYAYLTLVLFTPSIAAVGMFVASRATASIRRPMLIVIAVLLAAHVTHTVEQLRYRQGFQQLGTIPNKFAIAGLGAAVDAGQPILVPRIDDFVNSRVSSQGLILPEVRRTAADVPLNDKDRVNAEVAWMTDVSAKSYSLPTPTDTLLLSGFDRPLTGSGCETVFITKDLASLQFTVGQQGSAIKITTPDAKLVDTYVRRDFVTSVKQQRAAPKDSFWISSTAYGAVVLVGLGAPGKYTICH